MLNRLNTKCICLKLEYLAHFLHRHDTILLSISLVCAFVYCEVWMCDGQNTVWLFVCEGGWRCPHRLALSSVYDGSQPICYCRQRAVILLVLALCHRLAVTFQQHRWPGQDCLQSHFNTHQRAVGEMREYLWNNRTHAAATDTAVRSK